MNANQEYSLKFHPNIGNISPHFNHFKKTVFYVS